MSAAPGEPLTRRYRRRILSWGAAALVAIFVVGALVAVAHVEDDLSGRVRSDLVAAGFDGVDVSFSGQSGSVACRAPSTDPATLQEAVDDASDLRGVRSLDLADSCTSTPPGSDTTDGSVPADRTDVTGNSSSSPSTARTTSPTGSTPGGTTLAPATTPTTTASGTGSESTVAPANTIYDLINNDPQFSSLANAISATKLFDTLENDGPFTLFAPTNAAFEALSPEAAGALNADAELTRSMLLHHVLNGEIDLADLPDGPTEMLDGTTVDFVTTTDAGGERRVILTSGDITATVTDANLRASNGIVHVIDQVLLPPDIDLGVVQASEAEAVFSEGRFVLGGTVSNEAQRAAIVDAAHASVDPSSVVDGLTVDAASAMTDSAVADLAGLVQSMPVPLVQGHAVLGADGLQLSGVYVDDPGRAEIEKAGARFGDAALDLSPRPDATAADAITQQTDLNDYVDAHPLAFAAGSDAVGAESDGDLDALAAIAKRFSDVAIAVVGFTDTAGSTASNTALSQRRAATVTAALVDRGALASQLIPVGFGESSPILVDGVEDPDASRRVEFVVEVR